MTTIGFDTETHLIRPGALAPKMVCLTWDRGERAGIEHARERGALETAHLVFTYATIAAMSTAYDAAVLMAYDASLIPHIFRAYTEGRVVCVQENERLIDLARGRLNGFYTPEGKWIEIRYSLADLVRRRFGKDRSAEKSDPNGWRLRYAELENVALEDWPEAAKAYAIEDATDARDVYLDQMREHADLLRDQGPAQARAQLCLHLLSVEGVHTCPDTIEALRELTAQRFADLTAELQHHGLVRLNGTRDTKKAKARLIAAYRAQGIPWPITATGIDKAIARKKEYEGVADPGRPLADFLEPEEREQYAALDAVACEESEDDVLEMYAKRTSLAGIVDTHIPDLMKGVYPGTPIQAQFVTLVDSGRISCRKGRGGSTNGFQLTNPARGLEVPCPECSGAGCKACKDKGEVPSEVDIRSCFVAEPGYVFVDGDFPGLELCTVAQACKLIVGYSRLGEALNAGIDVHLLLAARLLGISYEDAVKRKHEPEVKHARQTAKPGNFGFWGGMGPAGFKRYARKMGVKVSLERAADIKRAWQEEFPETRGYFQHIRELCELGGGTATITQLYSGRVCSGMEYTEACNRYFQGLGADAAKDALFAVTRACYDPDEGSVLLGARPWNFVHDQILAKLPDVREQSLSERALRNTRVLEFGRLMTEACNVYLPDFPLRVEPCLSYAWQKNAEPVYDRDGLIVPWDWARAVRAECQYKDGSAVVWK